MNRKKKKNIFFLWKKGNFSFITKKNIFFLEEQTFIIYRYFFFFLGKEREGVYSKLKYLLPYLQFFFLLYAKTFLVNRYEH